VSETVCLFDWCILIVCWLKFVFPNMLQPTFPSTGTPAPRRPTRNLSKLPELADEENHNDDTSSQAHSQAQSLTQRQSGAGGPLTISTSLGSATKAGKHRPSPKARKTKPGPSPISNPNHNPNPNPNASLYPSFDSYSSDNQGSVPGGGVTGAGNGAPPGSVSCASEETPPHSYTPVHGNFSPHRAPHQMQMRQDLVPECDNSSVEGNASTQLQNPNPSQGQQVKRQSTGTTANANTDTSTSAGAGDYSLLGSAALFQGSDDRAVQGEEGTTKTAYLGAVTTGGGSNANK